jgi:hypothetical protein
MRLKIILSIFLFFEFFKIVDAQYRIDCIYLKNGNVYRGHVIRKNNDSVTLLTLSKNLIILANINIDSITKGNKRKEIRNYKYLTGNEHGRFNLFEIAGRVALYEGEGFGFGSTYYRGYKFRSNLSLAGGIGFLYKEDDRYEYYNQWRLSAVGGYDFPSRGDYPFISAEGGLQHIFSLPKLVRAPFWNCALGYCFKKRNGKAILVSAGASQNMNRFTVYNFNGFGPPHGSRYYTDWFYTYDLVFKIGFRL